MPVLVLSDHELRFLKDAIRRDRINSVYWQSLEPSEVERELKQRIDEDVIETKRFNVAVDNEIFHNASIGEARRFFVFSIRENINNNIPLHGVFTRELEQSYKDLLLCVLQQSIIHLPKRRINNDPPHLTDDPIS